MTEGKTNTILVAAIHIGTTYSGDAFSMKNSYETDPLKIHSNLAWNADGVMPLKTPTCLLLNSKKEFDSFGNAAEKKYANLVLNGEQGHYYYFHRFKMSMQNSKNVNSVMVLEDITGKTVPAIDIFALSIKALVDHVMHTIGARGTGVAPNDIQFVLTVPAVWTDNLKRFMRKSAIKAGIQQNHLLIIEETKASLIYCQNVPAGKFSGAKAGFSMSYVGNKCMIVDIGGATVNVTILEKLVGESVVELDNAFRDDCGVTSVSTEFLQLFENIFGSPLMYTFKSRHPLAYIELLREFEAVIMTIWPNKTGKIYMKLPYTTLDLLCHTHLKKDLISTVLTSTYSSSISIIGDKMKIGETLYKSLFERTIKSILELLQEMFKRFTFGTVTCLLLVGRFSECTLVQDAIRKSFSNNTVIVPEDSGFAVLKGAVIYGHSKKIVKSDISNESSSESSDEDTCTSICTEDNEDISSESCSGSSDEDTSLCSKDNEELTTYQPYVVFDEEILENFDYTKRKPLPLFSTAASEVLTGNKEQTDEKLEISETAKKTCETVLVSFEMTTSDIILRHGDINMDCYNHTVNAALMKQDIERNKKLWMHQSTPAAIRLGQVHGVLNAIKTKNYTEILKLYYRSQHQHTLDIHNKPVEIPVFIYRNQLENSWETALDNAITSINTATPGINLFETRDINESMIHIGVHESQGPMVACTMHGHIMQTPGKFKPFIHLGQQWNKDERYGTSVHELMHALSFNHEMQRFDSEMYLKINKNADDNYRISEDRVLTRFDPFSIMMYPMIEMEKKDGDSIWNLKDDGNQCQELSELNKVALNLVYQPCINKSKNFSPQLSIQTGMLYCGRPVMKTHNQVGKGTTDGFCGPNNWANCAACRVITRIKDKDNRITKIPKLEACLQKGKWQGLSGLFYCGKKDAKFARDLKFVELDGTCGPDTGMPCTYCGEELYKGYSNV